MVSGGDEELYPPSVLRPLVSRACPALRHRQGLPFSQVAARLPFTHSLPFSSSFYAVGSKPCVGLADAPPLIASAAGLVASLRARFVPFSSVGSCASSFNIREPRKAMVGKRAQKEEMKSMNNGKHTMTAITLACKRACQKTWTVDKLQPQCPTGYKLSATCSLAFLASLRPDLLLFGFPFLPLHLLQFLLLGFNRVLALR